MNWTRPFEGKIPYSPWKDFNLSQFGWKIRKALGWRRDEDGNNCTHREDFNKPDGTAYPDKSNLCHHFEQDGATADAIKISVQNGKGIQVVSEGTTGTDANRVVLEITKGTDKIFQVTADGTIRAKSATVSTTFV